jgi:hypothetical protein
VPKPGLAARKAAVVKAAKPVPEEGKFGETKNPARRRQCRRTAPRSIA